MESLESFIQNCVFIHDDTHTDLPESHWDQYATNPFLIGAKHCVVDSLEGFGDSYLAYLSKINRVPQTIIIPKYKYPSLLANLLEDEVALDKVKESVSKERLDISSFYTDKQKGFDKLVALLSNEEHTPSVYPPQKPFELAYDKVEMRQRMLKAGLSLPIGEICTSMYELLGFYTSIRSKHSKILVKETHMKTFYVSSASEIKNLEPTLRFPVVAEVAYSVLKSPVSHYFVWNEQVEHLFTVLQLVSDFVHQGNTFPSYLSLKEAETLADISKEIISIVSDYKGVFGIDFIITSSNQILPVDINARFNSSTYPFLFLKKSGDISQFVNARYRVVEKRIKNLSIIFNDPDFVRFDAKKVYGILLFNPVIDFNRMNLRKFSYLAIAKEQKDLVSLEALLLRIVNRYLL